MNRALPASGRAPSEEKKLNRLALELGMQIEELIAGQIGTRRFLNRWMMIMANTLGIAEEHLVVLMTDVIFIAEKARLHSHHLHRYTVTIKLPVKNLVINARGGALLLEHFQEDIHVVLESDDHTRALAYRAILDEVCNLNEGAQMQQKLLAMEDREQEEEDGDSSAPRILIHETTKRALVLRPFKKRSGARLLSSASSSGLSKREILAKQALKAVAIRKLKRERAAMARANDEALRALEETRDEHDAALSLLTEEEKGLLNINTVFSFPGAGGSNGTMAAVDDAGFYVHGMSKDEKEAYERDQVQQLQYYQRLKNEADAKAKAEEEARERALTVSIMGQDTASKLYGIAEVHALFNKNPLQFAARVYAGMGTHEGDVQYREHESYYGYFGKYDAPPEEKFEVMCLIDVMIFYRAAIMSNTYEAFRTLDCEIVRFSPRTFVLLFPGRALRLDMEPDLSAYQEHRYRECVKLAKQMADSLPEEMRMAPRVIGNLVVKAGRMNVGYVAGGCGFDLTEESQIICARLLVVQSSFGCECDWMLNERRDVVADYTGTVLGSDGEPVPRRIVLLTDMLIFAKPTEFATHDDHTHDIIQRVPLNACRATTSEGFLAIHGMGRKLLTLEQGDNPEDRVAELMRVRADYIRHCEEMEARAKKMTFPQFRKFTAMLKEGDKEKKKKKIEGGEGGSAFTLVGDGRQARYLRRLVVDPNLDEEVEDDEEIVIEGIDMNRVNGGGNLELPNVDNDDVNENNPANSPVERRMDDFNDEVAANSADYSSETMEDGEEEEEMVDTTRFYPNVPSRPANPSPLDQQRGSPTSRPAEPKRARVVCGDITKEDLDAPSDALMKEQRLLLASIMATAARQEAQVAQVAPMPRRAPPADSTSEHVFARPADPRKQPRKEDPKEGQCSSRNSQWIFEAEDAAPAPMPQPAMPPPAGLRLMPVRVPSWVHVYDEDDVGEEAAVPGEAGQAALQQRRPEGAGQQNAKRARLADVAEDEVPHADMPLPVLNEFDIEAELTEIERRNGGARDGVEEEDETDKENEDEEESEGDEEEGGEEGDDEDDEEGHREQQEQPEGEDEYEEEEEESSDEEQAVVGFMSVRTPGVTLNDSMRANGLMGEEDEEAAQKKDEKEDKEDNGAGERGVEEKNEQN